MKVLQIIDSFELNGGSTMFLELVSAMMKYTEYEILPYVVSKHGELGRKQLVDINLAKSYNVDIKVFSYKEFENISCGLTNSVIFHHVLGHTRNIIFHESCKCFIVNHTITNIHRLKKFKCDGIISVCKYFANILKTRTGLNSSVILNGCEDYYQEKSKNNSKFIIGCCQRVVASKFNIRRKSFPDNCERHVVGPCSISKSAVRNCRFFGPVFDRQRKIDIIRGFDVYLHDTVLPEGASMALLESLSLGIPVLAKSVGGGTTEIIKQGVNGYFYSNDKELYNLIKMLSGSPEKMDQLKKSTREDFLSRLHIKNNIPKYKRIFE